MKRTAILWLLLAASGVSGQLAPLGGKPKGPRVDIRLLLDRTGLVPGEGVGLAIAFDIEDKWHIYWRSGGESGNQPTFKWRLPKGYELGPILWPVPHRQIDGEGESAIHTFVLEGRPTLLTTLKVPADAKPGSEATIVVDAAWLVCKEMCVSGDKTLSMKFPIVPAGEAKPANQDVFAAARNRIPLPGDKAKHLNRLTAVAGVDKVRPGDKFKVAVVFDIKEGHHLNSHHPLDEFLIPTDVFHDDATASGAVIGRAEFPPGLEETAKGQKLSVYRGKVAVILPVEADPVLTEKEMRLSGIAAYQACTDKTGQCYPPTAAEWALTLPVAEAGTAVAEINKDVFEGKLGGRAQAQMGGTGTSGGFSLNAKLKTTVQQEEHSVIVWLLLALLAGLILNVTPCVLPVISIKVLSFVQQASQSPARVFKLGIAFSIGMLVVFNALAALATMAGLVWGQHFQSPQFTVAMSAIVFAFSLSLFGVYTLSVPQSVGSLAARADQKEEGYIGSIAKGGLATIMGTPCLGPFLGPVLVWATTQPAAMVFLVFNTIGLGMALPYVLLTANPRWLRFVPRPGPWLATFKQAMAFLLVATVVYLLYIVEGQLGGRALVWTLVFLLGVSLACWIVGTWVTFQSPLRTRWVAWGIAVTIVGMSAWIAFGLAVDLSEAPPATPLVSADSSGPESQSKELPWVPFSLKKLEELTAEGKPVFLDITARWCPNCQWNSRFVLNTSTVAEAVEHYGAVPMLADWTAREELIGDLIEKLAPGASIPLAVMFPAGRPTEPIVMLGILSKQQVVDAVRQGGRATNMASEATPAEGG